MIGDILGTNHMIKITDSTVFNVGADCIVNTINCIGVMGKGVALEFALRYPELERLYVKDCRDKKIHTGHVYFYEIDGQKIVNFPTKFHFKYPSKIEWIEQGLQDFINNYKKWNIKSVAFPLLGATNGGLDPKIVEKLMVEYLSKLDIDVYICHSLLVEGRELKMVTAFKKSSLEEVRKHVRLSSKQYLILEKYQNQINRFADILKLEGIGIDTYKSLYGLFYNGDEIIDKQLSLF